MAIPKLASVFSDWSTVSLQEQGSVQTGTPSQSFSFTRNFWWKEIIRIDCQIQNNIWNKIKLKRPILFGMGHLRANLYWTPPPPVIFTINTSWKTEKLWFQQSPGDSWGWIQTCNAQVPPNYYLIIYTWFEALWLVFLQYYKVLCGPVWL